jgi:HSP20 family protein|tara:strand:+ start:768 stop:1109 length:342 start_codon:yes stop_codon:yes gene_type:complete
MLLTQDLLNNFFDDSFAIRKMNKINYTDDVTHDDDGATIKLKVPGFNKKSIDISVDSETLTIEGKTDDDSFTKRYSVDNKFDFDSIDAKVSDGLLTLSLPYKAEVKPRKIKVN